MLSEKILFGEVRPGQIVLVDAEGEGDEAIFTFVGEQKASLPDEPLVEAAAASPAATATPSRTGSAPKPKAKDPAGIHPAGRSAQSVPTTA